MAAQLERAMKAGVIGLGYWGPNLVRNLLSTPGIEGVVVCDRDAGQLEKIRQKFPMVETVEHIDQLLGRDDVTAVAVSTPISTHHPIGMQVLGAGKHLLLEKPMAASTRECDELIALAEKKNLRLMVDHTFIYNGAVRKVKELIDRGEIGEILYFDSVRVNLGLFQHDSNVVWDLAPHDISIMDWFIGDSPIAVSATGSCHFNNYEDIAYLTVHFPGSVMAHFHVNWISPVKVRQILLGGTRHMVVYDDMEPSEKVKVYDKGVEVTGKEQVWETLVQYRTGDMCAPKIDQTEALSRMMREFVDSIREGRAPLTDGHAGRTVVAVLEAADRSLKNQGARIEIAR